MKRIYLLSIILMSVLMLSPSKAQETRTMSFDAATSLMLAEFQAMLVEEDGEIKVRMRMGGSDESGDKLERGDLIIMMNGKRAANIAELRKIYESVPKDEEVKIGVRRGNERFILQKMKGDMPEGGPRMVMRMETDGDGEQPIIIPELGFLLADNESDVSIRRMLEPLLPQEIKDLDIDLEGFTINTINNTKPKSAAHAKELIAELKVGDSISFQLSKNDDEVSFTIKKPEAKGNVNISIDG